MRHLLSSALLAGLVAGLLAALLQFLLVEPDIVLAERYETGELVHFAGLAAGAGMGDHTHASTAPETASEAAPDATAATHDHDHAAAEDASPLLRHALTVGFAILTYCGYALLLVGAMSATGAVPEGNAITHGILWGLAGFMAFQLLPAIGLQPDVPGTPSADLYPRQIWWASTALATIVGLWLLAFGKGVPVRLVAVLILAAPHIVGAPQVAEYGGLVPPELAAHFAARSLALGFIVWSVLGAATAYLWQSEAR